MSARWRRRCARSPRERPDLSVHIESAGRGRPLVLLHGWAMHSGLWLPLLPRLIDRYRVHSVDLPGHGYSSSVAPFDVATLATDVAAAVSVLPDVAVTAPVVLGWSLGGLVALEWARARPGTMRALALVAAPACFVQRPDWPHAMAPATLVQFGDELAASYRRTLLRFLTLQVQSSDHGRAALALLRNHLFDRGEPDRETLRAGLALLAATDLRGALAGIEVSTLVIGGDRDTLVPSDSLRRLAAALPHATLALIPGAAHAPFLSHPEDFEAALNRFCDDL
jgi:pimeloyl-[acyl-carrier protein] methyl ester esterase